MAEDLDRAYVINGDDLRIALSGMNGAPQLVSNPRDVTEYLLGKIACPLGAEAREEPDDDDGPCEFIRDTELATIAAILAAVDVLPDSEAGLSRGPVWRVLRYAAERYGYVLCTED